MRFLIGRLRLAKRLFAGTDEARHLSLRRLRKAHRAQILAILEDMQAEPGGEDRYLAVHPAGKPERYVQCLIEDDDKALCEIASGFYLTVEGEPR